MKGLLAISSVVFTVSVIMLPTVWGDNDFSWREIERHEHASGLAVKKNATYEEECGSCHMAYPAGLLPEKSWNKIMEGLEHHFSEDADIDMQSKQIISQYLTKNSADKAKVRHSYKFNRSINANQTPLRITDVPYFKHEHHEIPKRMVTANTDVKSLSQCDACHKQAEQGLFDEHDVSIPNYGAWDD